MCDFYHVVTGALTKKMLLNKELLQGEVLSETSSNVSIKIMWNSL